VRFRSAIIVLLYTSAALLHAGEFRALFATARRRRRVRRRILAERELLARLERAWASTDAGSTRRL